jgi:hypothetical protein
VEPIEKKDNRFKDGRPHQAFEVEALGQSVVMQTVRERLEELAPSPLSDVQEHEQAECKRMLEVLELLGELSRAELARLIKDLKKRKR